MWGLGSCYWLYNELLPSPRANTVSSSVNILPVCPYQSAANTLILDGRGVQSNQLMPSELGRGLTVSLPWWCLCWFACIVGLKKEIKNSLGFCVPFFGRDHCRVNIKPCLISYLLCFPWSKHIDTHYYHQCGLYNIMHEPQGPQLYGWYSEGLLRLIVYVW